MPFPVPTVLCPSPVQTGEGPARPVPSTVPQGNMDAPPLNGAQLNQLLTSIPYFDSPPQANFPKSMMLLPYLCQIKHGYFKPLIDAFLSSTGFPVELSSFSFADGLPGARLTGEYKASGEAPAKPAFNHTGLIGAIFDCKDHPGKTAAEIRDQLAKDNHVLACWRTVADLGVEAIFKVRADHDFHLLVSDAIESHCATLGLKLNQATWLPFRISPVSFDPDIWINLNGVVELAPENLDNYLSNEGADGDFPIWCLSGVAGEMAKAIAQVTTSQNLSLAAVSVIGFASASIGAGIRFCLGGERWIRGNLYIMAIAKSGNGKTESFGLAGEPFREAEIEAVDAFKQNQLPRLMAELDVVNVRLKKLPGNVDKASDPITRQALLIDLQDAQRRKSDIAREIATEPRYQVGDVTKEQLAVLMQGQPGEAMASMSSEARGVMSVIRGRYNRQGGDEDLYCSAYSGESIKVDRVGRPKVILKSPCLAACWMVQPDVIRTSLQTSSISESGLLPRCLTFNSDAEPKVRPCQPDPIPNELKIRWAALIRSLLNTYRAHGANPFTAPISIEASKVLKDYEDENIRRRRGDGDLFDHYSYVARWSENASKMTLILHCTEHGEQAHIIQISRQSAENAVELMRWFSDEQLSVLSVGREEAAQRRYSELVSIVEANGGTITMRELRRRHHFSQSEVEGMIRESSKHLKVHNLQPKKGGRPTLIVTILGPEAWSRPDSTHRVVPPSK